MVKVYNYMEILKDLNKYIFITMNTKMYNDNIEVLNKERFVAIEDYEKLKKEIEDRVVKWLNMDTHRRYTSKKKYGLN